MDVQWMRRAIATMVGGVVLTGGGLFGAAAQAVQPVTQLDLSRFTGTWYELARLPNKAEKKCVGDALALYGLEDKPNHFSVVGTCTLKDGAPQVHDDSGKRAKGTTDGRLSTTYFVFLHHKQWVLAVAPDYSWSLVGNPNHKELWFYSRTESADPAVMADLRSRAAAQGYDVSKVVLTSQTNSIKPKEVVKPDGAVAAATAP